MNVNLGKDEKIDENYNSEREKCKRDQKKEFLNLYFLSRKKNPRLTSAEKFLRNFQVACPTCGEFEKKKNTKIYVPFSRFFVYVEGYLFVLS